MTGKRNRQRCIPQKRREQNKRRYSLISVYSFYKNHLGRLADCTSRVSLVWSFDPVMRNERFQNKQVRSIKDTSEGRDEDKIAERD